MDEGHDLIASAIYDVLSMPDPNGGPRVGIVEALDSISDNMPTYEIFEGVEEQLKRIADGLFAIAEAARDGCFLSGRSDG